MKAKLETISQVLRSLYELLVIGNNDTTRLSFCKIGHIFEDNVAVILNKFGDISEVKVRRPIGYPTISGIKDHQFDCSFKYRDMRYVVECKKQNKLASKNQMYYFNSTITDHILGMKIDGINEELHGIFLSTTDLDDKSMIYAITNGIKFVTPSYPPLEYMLSKIEDESRLGRSIRFTMSLLPNKNPLLRDPMTRNDPSPAQLYEQYLSLLKEWKHNILTICPPN